MHATRANDPITIDNAYVAAHGPESLQSADVLLVAESIGLLHCGLCLLTLRIALVCVRALARQIDQVPSGRFWALRETRLIIPG